MAIPVELEMLDQDGVPRSPYVIKRNGENGMVVFNEDLREFDVLFSPAFNPDFGVEMAQDFSFSGTPVGVHDGTDTAFWTASAIVGTKFTFDSTDEANSGTKSVKANKAALNDVMEFDRLSDLDLSNYVAITLFVFVASRKRYGTCASNRSRMAVCTSAGSGNCFSCCLAKGY